MDLTNGIFEAVGSVFIWISVVSLYRAKGYAGIHIGQIVFYAAWGLWNVFYYPALGQWWSFLSGINVLIANIIWVSLAVKYGKIDRSRESDFLDDEVTATSLIAVNE